MAGKLLQPVSQTGLFPQLAADKVTGTGKPDAGLPRITAQWPI